MSACPHGYQTCGADVVVVCQWSHDGLPQLFWLSRDAADTNIPSSCAVVRLIPELVLNPSS